MSTEPRPGCRWIILGAANGFLAVALGAFAAHGLKGRLSETMLGVFDKGVDYQAMHAMALLATGLIIHAYGRSRWLTWAGGLFLAGILLFSGSLYILATTQIRGWGIVTPFGGMAFLGGWLCLAWGAWRAGK